jgi:hypothetical protein
VGQGNPAEDPIIQAVMSYHYLFLVPGLPSEPCLTTSGQKKRFRDSASRAEIVHHQNSAVVDPEGSQTLKTKLAENTQAPIS